MSVPNFSSLAGLEAGIRLRLSLAKLLTGTKLELSLAKNIFLSPKSLFFKKSWNKIVYLEHTLETKLVAQDKPENQHWFHGTKLGGKIGYPEQTRDPKVDTQN